MKFPKLVKSEQLAARQQQKKMAVALRRSKDAGIKLSPTEERVLARVEQEAKQKPTQE